MHKFSIIYPEIRTLAVEILKVAFSTIIDNYSWYNYGLTLTQITGKMFISYFISLS